MPKAEQDGVYEVKDEATGETNRFFVAKGDEVPEGAEVGPVEQPTEERAIEAAPENKARSKAPERN